MPSTYIDPSRIPGGGLPNYSNFQAPYLPTTGGYGGGSSGMPWSMDAVTGVLSGGASVVPNLLGRAVGLDHLFDKAPQWKPYYDPQSGQYFFTDPKTRNPVPLPNVPGAPLKPNQNYRKTAGNIQGIYDMMPYLNDAINSGIVPNAMAQLEAAQATSPGYAELMTNLYNTYGPQLNEIGNAIQRQNQLAGAETTNAVLEGPGKQTVADALALQQSVDQPWFDTRQATSDNLAKLFNSIDTSGNLSAGENRQIGQGLAQQQAQTGMMNAPSASNTVANAMQYGQAGYQRKQEGISNLSKAIQSAAAFMPTAKSGIDAFQTATGRTSMANSGNALFPGINQSGNAAQGAYGLAGNLLGNMGNVDVTQMGIDANKKDWLDQFQQFSSGLSNIGGMVGKGAMMGL